MLTIKAPAVGKTILAVAQDPPKGRKELGLGHLGPGSGLKVSGQGKAG